MPDTKRDLEQRVRDVERRLDEVAGFVLAVAFGPPDCATPALRRRARELLDLFDADVGLRVVQPDEMVRKRGNRDG
ncbi:MAG: hypothetical protein WAO08_09205 [Hyphomicrobiaceae bacterium]|jgi:hypothetical protein